MVWPKHNFIENNLIILSKQTLDIFLKEKNPDELISLYCFYYYTAKWQKTNQPKASINYCAKALHWGLHKTRRVKQQLEKMCLIKDAKEIDEKTGRVKGWYVKVNYLWKSTLPETVIVDEKSTLPVYHRVDSRPTNALSVSSLNALSANKYAKTAENGGFAPFKKFNLYDELNLLKNDKRRHIQLIGEYLEEKKVPIESKEELQVAIKRHVRPAVALAKFSDQRIGWATEKAEKEYPQYTLETLIKILTR